MAVRPFLAVQCVGGPLDGSHVLWWGYLAFPWPEGWYYLRYERSGDSPILRTRDEPTVYVWDGEPSRFIDVDRRWLEDHGNTIKVLPAIASET